MNDLSARAGEDLGVSDWHLVTQGAIDAFADVTGDRQWIHTDRERARSTPFGGTIAHGYYTLALAPTLLAQVFPLDRFGLAVNYGLDKLRFPAPLAVGERVRLRARLDRVDVADDGAMLAVDLTFEREGGDKPVCVAKALYRVSGDGDAKANRPGEPAEHAKANRPGEPAQDAKANGPGDLAQPGNENLAGNLIHSATAHPDAPAVRMGDSQLTYVELAAASAKVAGLLRSRGIEPGDRVGIMLPNVPEFAVAYYGVLRAGGVVVPMNVQLKQREVAFYLGDSGAKLVFAWHGCADAAHKGAAEAGSDVVTVEPAAFETLAASTFPAAGVTEREGDDTAVILYTSGTTGRPKGAELTHSNLGRNVEVAARTLFKLTPGDVILGALPLFHSFGQTCGLNAAVKAGACLALIPRFDPQAVLETIEREGVTIFEGVPTMYSALLNHPGHNHADVSTLRLCVSGGAALPVEVLRSFEDVFGCIILEGYGLSETSPVASFNHPDRDRRPGSIGTPIEGVEMRLLDVEDGVGEIAIRGHNVMKGYWQRPEATAEAIDADGWFRSGDLARVDADGCFFIVDRKKELIIRGGYNVYPRELEEVLHEHPAVREVAVLGIPHPELGEEVAAAVALKPDQSVTAADLRDFVKSQVAAYKYPRHVWLVDSLPKGPTGKILKRAIQVPE
jgi:long-chain acyl-CoA synthetase